MKRIAIRAVSLISAAALLCGVFSVKPDFSGITVKAEQYDNNVPVCFDGRDYGFVYTPVKSQGEYGACWAHAFTAAVETSMIKKGLASSDINLSELQLANAAYGKAVDKDGLLGNDYIAINTGSDVLSLGGNHTLSALTMNRWNALCDEDVMNYEKDSEYAISGIASFDEDVYSGLNEAYLRSYFTVDSQETEEIKSLIREYGIGITAYYSNDKYLNTETGAYYSNRYITTNHEVAVIGWDDNYPRENFLEACRPENDGAWLARNSRGGDYGNDGYIWLSYEDTSLDYEFAFTEAVSSDEWDHNYQYDGGSSFSRVSSTGGVANIYTATGNQELKAVSISSLSVENATYTVKIYKNPNSATSFVVTDTPVYTGSFRVSHKGIYTLDLETPVELAGGDTFAIYLKNNSGSTFYDSSKTVDEGKLTYYEDVTSARCYTVSKNGNSTRYKDGAIRIKAFTVDSDIATPDNLMVRLENNSVCLSWNEVEKADYYEIFGGTDNCGYEFIEKTDKTAVTLPASSDNGIILKYKVRAVNDKTSGNFCNARAVRFDDVYAQGISVSDIIICENETLKLNAEFTPTDVKDRMIAFTVEDESVAGITPDGFITGRSTGTTSLVFVSRNGGHIGYASVTVVEEHTCVSGEAETENEISATCSENGSFESAVYCTVCNRELCREVVVTPLAEHKESGTETVSELLPGCVTPGSIEKITRCTECGIILSVSGTVIAANGHSDKDADGICDVCGEALKSDCNHLCHKTGFTGFIWKIINLINKLFGLNPVCDCGAAHY